jgi:hypothetical protein
MFGRSIKLPYEIETIFRKFYTTINLLLKEPPFLKQKKPRGLPHVRRSRRIASNTKRGETANTRRDKNGIYEKAEEERERERERASFGSRAKTWDRQPHRSYIWIHTGLRWTGEQGEREEVLGDVMRRVRRKIWEI